jgi:hypothetical protein
VSLDEDGHELAAAKSATREEQKPSSGTAPLYTATSGAVILTVFEGDRPAGPPGLYTGLHGFPGYYIAQARTDLEGRATPCTTNDYWPNGFQDWQRAMTACLHFLSPLRDAARAAMDHEQDKRERPRTPQDFQLELIRHAVGDRFDGNRVADDLTSHRGLWDAALMDSPVLNIQSTGLAINLIKLKALREDVWSADTLYILTSGRTRRKKLATVARRWQPAEMGWLSPHVVEERTGSPGGDVLFLWWD